MGNETSSVKIHSLLTADDFKDLRSGFPGGGAPSSASSGPETLNWSPWPELWPEARRKGLEAVLKGQNETFTFHVYQELAGCSVRGTTEERTKLIFKLVDPTSKTLSTIKASALLELVEDIIDASSRTFQPKQYRDDSVKVLAQSLLHDLVFVGQSRKQCLYKSPESDPDLDFDTVERWLAMSSPLCDKIFQLSLAKSFQMSLLQDTMMPKSELDFSNNTLLRPAEALFLNSCLGHELRSKWRLLFNSRMHGESFAKMSSSILDKGPTFIIMWEQNSGHIFGGHASQSWKVGPKFYGANQNFLFSLKPRMYMYESTSFNQNYQYMNLKAKTLPNGIGFGGQLDYFGLWIDAEYGKARCAPSCSSYQNPQVSKEEYFHYDHLEVWAVGEEPVKDDDDEEGGTSALDLDPEAQAVMEMMGKTFVSKDVRAADEANEKNT